MLADVTLEDWLTAAGIAAGTILVTVLIGRLLMVGLNRRLAQPSLAVGLVVRIVRWTILLFGFVYAASVVGVEIGPLIGALGLGGLAIALALQPVLQNLFAGVVLQTERPLECGEEVSTNGYDGVVLDVTGRAVVLKTFDGELVTIPNSRVLDNPVVNHTRDRIRRSRVEVGVAYSSDLATATEVLRDAVMATGGVMDEPAPVVVATAFNDSSIDFELDFWHVADETEERVTRAAVMTSVHAALAAADITIPFPQTDVHLPREA
ncbi:MAG: mechanosensitive ion channel domain-containing protein [Actinomycetota bacterium]